MSDKAPPHPVIAHLKVRFKTQTRLAQAAEVRPHTISGKRSSENPLTYTQLCRIVQNGPDMGVEITLADLFPQVAA